MRSAKTCQERELTPITVSYLLGDLTIDYARRAAEFTGIEYRCWLSYWSAHGLR